MAAGSVGRPLVVIVGPTASGKTAAAVALAERYGGEVICADSRTVFREMNIGTAKPSSEEQRGIPHWGLDLTAPGERFTAAAFQEYANEMIQAIRSRGNLPIMVGGTGLYIDGILFDYRYPAEPSPEVRRQFEAMSLPELYNYCVDNNIKLPINDKNKRHVVRSIIHNGVSDRRRTVMRNDTIAVSIATKPTDLQTQIAQRTEHMFDDGVVEEATMLGKKYGWGSGAMTGNIYPIIHEYLNGSATLDEAKQAFRARDWQLAKRQMTWFRRNPYLVWCRKDEVGDYVANRLAREYNL